MTDSPGSWPTWRLAIYALPGVLLLIPLTAMAAGLAVDWTGFDFAFGAVFLYALAALCDAAVRLPLRWLWRVSLVAAMLCGAALLWGMLALAD